MDEKNKNINSFTAADIRRYLDGKLSSGEMYVMEKAALDDPFLADAMAGTESIGAHDVFESGMATLNQNLAKRIEAEKDKKRAPLYFRWQAAAALLLLLGSAYLGWILLIKNPGKPADISRVVPPKTQPAAPVKGKTDSGNPGTGAWSDKIVSNDPNKQANNKRIITPVPEQGEPKADKDLAKQQVLSDREEKAKRRESSEREKPSVKTETEKTPAEVPATADLAKADRRDDNHVSAAPAPAAVNDDRRAEDRALEGKVAGLDISRSKRKDKSHKPVEKFRNGSESDSTTAVGTKADSLEEVVVTAYGPAKKKSIVGYSVTEISTDLAEPVKGWTDFYEYITKNKNISTADSLVRGQEIISFLVHKNGRLSNFKIEQSLSPTHDQELIRLVKAGPAWKIQKGKKQKARVSVSF